MTPISSGSVRSLAVLAPAVGVLVSRPGGVGSVRCGECLTGSAEDRLASSIAGVGVVAAGAGEVVAAAGDARETVLRLVKLTAADRAVLPLRLIAEATRGPSAPSHSLNVVASRDGREVTPGAAERQVAAD